MALRAFRGVLATLAAVSFASGCAKAQSGPHKPALSGLVSVGSIKFHRRDGVAPDNSLGAIAAKPGAFGGVVMNIGWFQIEPSQGQFDTRAINEALAQIRDYNRSHPQSPLAADLRIWPGRQAPEWVKRLGGSAVTVHRTLPGQPGEDLTIGAFWTPAYRRAYAEMQHELARRYDAEPLIAEVSNTACSTLSDEPFNLPHDADSVASLHRSGFSDAAYRDCLETSPGDFSGWRATNIQFAFNPFHRTDGDQSAPDYDFPSKLMGDFRRSLGARAIISTHALMNGRPFLAPLFNAIKSEGGPIELQTEVPRHQNFSWDQTIAYAVSLGASSVEVWPDPELNGYGNIPEATLQQWAAELKGNRR
ncbi:MAG TPA: hypothetical protein VII63_09700 [Caulobacteraceae bacterium]